MAKTPYQTNRFDDIADDVYLSVLGSDYMRVYNLGSSERRGPILRFEFWTPAEYNAASIHFALVGLWNFISSIVWAATPHAVVTSEYFEPNRFLDFSHGCIVIVVIFGRGSSDPTQN